MVKRLLIAFAILASICIPAVVLAHSLDISATTYYACEDTSTGKIDPNSITQNDVLLESGSCPGSDAVVQWNVTGPKGDTGPQGNQGNPGPIGPAGPPGTDGKDGIQGIPGPQGSPGPKGDKGDTGLTGPAGTPGTDGTNGTNGTNGTDGAPGAPGISGWNIVVHNYTNLNPGILVFARCALGQNVLGGGAALGHLNSGDAISLSRPSGLDGWGAAYMGPKTTFSVYAICGVVAH